MARCEDEGGRAPASAFLKGESLFGLEFAAVLVRRAPDFEDGRAQVHFDARRIGHHSVLGVNTEVDSNHSSAPKQHSAVCCCRHLASLRGYILAHVVLEG